MAGVAEQRDAAFAPSRQRLALEDRPLVAIRTRVEHRAYFGVEAGEGCAQFGDIAFGGPRFRRDPVLALRLAGDEVDLVARLRRVVDDDMAVLAPPLRPRRAEVATHA